MPTKLATKPSPEVDAYLKKSKKWPRECAQLREILLDSGLSEALKWGKPCYSHDGHNIAIIQEFKAFVALMFFKGALLSDPHGLLEKQGENTRSALRMCFTSPDEVVAHKRALRDYVKQAIAVEKAGLKIPESASELVLVDELAARLKTDPKLRAAFSALTPGRQRAYNLYFSGAKQSETRAARIDKVVPQILAGKGLRD